MDSSPIDAQVPVIPPASNPAGSTTSEASASASVGGSTKESDARDNPWRVALAFLAVVVVLLGLLGYLRYRAGLDHWGEAIHFSDGLTIYRGKGATSADTEALAEFLLPLEVSREDDPTTVRLERNESGYTLYLFWASNRDARDEQFHLVMRRLRDEISKKVFAGQPVVLLLCSPKVDRNAFGALAEPHVLKVID